MSKDVKMMVLRSCPYCRQAFQIIEELKAEHPEYQQIAIEVIEEDKEPETANRYDYWYVPSFYVDGKKLHEGVPSKSKLDFVLSQALL